MTRNAVLMLSATLSGLSLTTTHARAGSRVDVRADEAARRVSILVDGRPFTEYIWPQRLAKPVLFPLRSAQGTIVTRGFPLAPREGERVDHPHQVGLWFNYGDVNGVDFWNNSEARAPEERAKAGTIRHVAIEKAEGGEAGRLAVRLDWRMPDGTAALRENAVYLFSGGGDRRVVERTTTLEAARRVVLGDNKEGLFALRVAGALEEPSGAVFTSSEGTTGAGVWGTRARWMALAGRIGSEDVVLLVLDHPLNPGHPTRWHARGYGLFAANPLGRKAFGSGEPELALTLEPSGRVRFRHRLLILSRPFSREEAEAAWKAFAAERE